MEAPGRTSKNPFALAPRACTTRSGMRSRSNCMQQTYALLARKRTRSTTNMGTPSKPAKPHLGKLLDQVVVLQQDGTCKQSSKLSD